MENYYPIFKAKAAEFKSIYALPSEVRKNIVPIFDIVTNQARVTLKEHMLKIYGYFSLIINHNSTVYLDFYMLSEKSNKALKIFQKRIFGKWKKIIYVINKDTPQEFLSVLREIKKQRNNGICIRIFLEDFDNINNIVEDLKEKMDVDYEEIDLLLDMRYLKSDMVVNQLYNELINHILKIRNLNRFRNFILSGSSFPVDLSELKADTIHTIERKEWKIWKKIMKEKPTPRIPKYSDYLISNPLLSAFGDNPPNASASIRYTSENDFYIYRGRGTRQHSYKQFFDISESLINSQEYYGEKHCDGDKFIQICGTVKNKTGNLETWRKVGTTHHLTVAVNQILQLFRVLRI